MNLSEAARAFRRGFDRVPLLTPWTPQAGPQHFVYHADDVEQVLYGGQAGGGKALALDTPIPTPAGWTTMGALCEGDEVFDDRGQPCRVVHAFDVLHGRPCFEVVLSDGATIVADADHKWVTSTVAERDRVMRTEPTWQAARRSTRAPRGKGKRPDLAARNTARAAARRAAPPIVTASGVRTTSEILATLRDGVRANHAIRVQEALQLPDAELLVDPYVLGAWLGDGTSASGAITTADPEILTYIQAAGFDVRKQRQKYAWGILGLRKPLRLAGLIGNKHVPRVYLRASERQRLSLLQGLMDTDGNVANGGQCEFTTTSEALRDGALELLASLGIKATAREGVARL